MSPEETKSVTDHVSRSLGSVRIENEPIGVSKLGVRGSGRVPPSAERKSACSR